MAGKPLHVACSPLTNTIYAGSVREDAQGRRTWLSNRTEVTNEAVGAVIEHIGAGNVLTVSVNGRPAFEVEVRDLSAPAATRLPTSKEPPHDG